MTIRVIIADDQNIIRAGLTTILNGQPDIDVIGQAADGRDAVALARREAGVSPSGPRHSSRQPLDRSPSRRGTNDQPRAALMNQANWTMALRM